ncbi:MAG: hypothetical protein ACRDP6_32760 [Actinoallomurus sp.]
MSAPTIGQITEHPHVAQARQMLAELGAARITQMSEGDLFSWCSRLEVTARRLLLLADRPTTPGRTVRDALIELAELAIDNPEMDDQLVESARNLTPNCASSAHRLFWWVELKACVEQYDRGDLTADGPDHWAGRRDEALNELIGSAA